MMKNLRKNKSGISLIVLVITIIVMIILAAAIILSLSNSGIISKANKAKTDSDTANLKEYVNTLRAEWELMTEAERTESGAATFEDYANKKLEKSGYNGAVGADGEVYSNLNENAMAAIKAGIKVGDVVTRYTVAANTYETSGEENTGRYIDDGVYAYVESDPQPQTVASNTEVTWKYLGINASGEMEIMADLSTTTGVAANTKITLGGKGGYLKGPGMLNTVCKKLYSKDGVGTARSMNIDDVNNLLGYTPTYTYTYNSSTITSITPLTIATLESKLGIKFDGSKTTTPDGKDRGTYYSNYYQINKTDDVKEMKKPGNIELVYNAQNTYWLASSSCFYESSGYNRVHFGVRMVYRDYVNVVSTFSSIGASSDNYTYALRPVVTLNSNVKLTPNADKTEWVIS
mgnify:CR=1 FL=1